MEVHDLAGEGEADAATILFGSEKGTKICSWLSLLIMALLLAKRIWVSSLRSIPAVIVISVALAQGITQ